MNILPAATPLSQPYWDGAREHRVLFQECRVCGANWHPPMPMCPNCHSRGLRVAARGRRGFVSTFTVVHHGTHPAFADQLPYVVAVIELDEGPRIVTNVKKCAPGDVHGGMRVSIFFEDVTDSVTLPQAMPA